MNTNVYFRNFWESNDNTKLFLKDLFQNIGVTTKDIYITSVFLKKSILTKVFNHFKMYKRDKFTINNYQKIFYNLDGPLKKSNVLNVWYTGENIRPPSSYNWDLLLTFETDRYFINEEYLPFWATNLGTSIEEAKIRQKKLLQQRNVSKQNKKFACAIIGNPHPIRMQIIDEVMKIGEVECFGSAFGKKVKDKELVLSNFNFNICFENDLYPGYVTEKVFDSWNSYCIPIWWGVDPLGYINQDAVIDFAKLGFSDGLEKIRYLVNNPKEMQRIQGLPILSKEFDYDLLCLRISKILSK